jgi:hypothetical protein
VVIVLAIEPKIRGFKHGRGQLISTLLDLVD